MQNYSILEKLAFKDADGNCNDIREENNIYCNPYFKFDKQWTWEHGFEEE